MEPSEAIAIAGILVEVANSIGGLVRSALSTETIEENKQAFQNSSISYHDKVRKLLYEEKGSPRKLAEEIHKDRIFCYYARDDNVQEIIRALIFVDERRGTKTERRRILQNLLHVFERARVR